MPTVTSTICFYELIAEILTFQLVMSCDVGGQYQTTQKPLCTVKSPFLFLCGVADLNIKLRKVLNRGKPQNKDYKVVPLRVIR
jgi:hypothetical protein